MKAAAARRLQRERLNGDMGRLLEELELDAAGSPPVVLLLGAVHRCAAMVQVLGTVVGGLTADTLYGPDHLGDGRPHVATEMYATWLDRLARASKLAIDAGVEERMVRLAEDQARLIAEAMRAFAVSMGHDPADEAVQIALRRSLTVVAGGAAA